MTQFHHLDAPLGACIAGPTTRLVLDPNAGVGSAQPMPKPDFGPAEDRVAHCMSAGDPVDTNPPRS